MYDFLKPKKKEKSNVWEQTPGGDQAPDGEPFHINNNINEYDEDDDDDDAPSIDGEGDDEYAASYLAN